MEPIEKIDKQISTLVEQRIEQLRSNSPHGSELSPQCIENYLRAIQHELKLQETSILDKLKVGYLGPEGTFSHQMALDIFGDNATLVPLRSIDEVFTEVSKNNLTNGVVPVENSINGSVVQTHDMLLQNITTIQAESSLEINHCLFSNHHDGKYTKIYSHPQPIGQCWQWLQHNQPQAQLIETSSTTAAIQKAIEDKEVCAAIGCKISSKLYPIKLVKENIQDFGFNQTRFLIIGKPIRQVDGPYKTSMSITLKDKPGALFELLQAFQEESINLTRIESRPNKKEAWCYNFLIDFEGNQNDLKIQRVLKNLKNFVFSSNVLGSYRKVI